jgi:hypothetical protein
MSRREPDIQAWTPDEDIFLSQGYAAFHDERTNQPDFVQIHDRFPFHETRKVGDLADRWRDITEHLEAEDQEVITRMRTSSKTHRPQSWTYRCEPPAETPSLPDILEDYRQMPSLALKTQLTESSVGRFATDSRNVNESCLNHQFEAGSVNHIVLEVLQKIVDDVPLRETLSREFRTALVRRGREFATRDASRKLEIINEIKDAAVAEQERQLMFDYFERLMQGIQARTSRQGVGDAIVDDCISVLAALADVVWPARPSAIVEGLQKDFKKRFAQTTTTFLRMQSTSPLISPFLRGMTEFDRAAEFDQFFEQFRAHIVNYRRQKMGVV